MEMRHLAASLLAAVSLTTVAHAMTPPGARVAAMAPSASVDFEVFLPLRNKPALEALLKAQQTPGSASYHQWLTPAQFGAQFGPKAASIANDRAAIEGAGLQVTKVHTRSFHVAGTADQVGKLLQTQLNTATLANGHTHAVAAKPITLSGALKQEGATIVAFTGIPEKHVNSMRVPVADPNGTGPTYERSLWFDDMKQAYDYPSYQTILPNGNRLDGTGVNIAILMSGAVLNSDVAKAFNHEHFTDTTGLQPPTVTILPVDGGPPPFPYGAADEAALDVQMALGGSPGANLTLVGIPDLSDEFITDAYVTIVDENKWDVVSSSFGGCELGYTPAYNLGVDETGVLFVYDEIFEQGNAEGITFSASSGDSGGLECPSVSYAVYGLPGVFVPGVEFPADSPHVTAVGGGNLLVTPLPTTQTRPPTYTANYVSENSVDNPEIPYSPYGFDTNVSGGVWDAGGGVSQVFATPTYQNWLAFYGEFPSGRAVPDIGMEVGGCPGGISQPGCPLEKESYVNVVLDGQYIGLIGTSVSSPEFTGGLALFVELAGRQGNVNPLLWSQGYTQVDLGGEHATPQAQFFHKNQPGKDGVFFHNTTYGFDFMYGNGSPDVRKLLGITNFAPAGNPQTPSNP